MPETAAITSPAVNARIPPQGENAHDTETRPSNRSGSESASPPRIIGARRRRSSSEESSSTRPRSRSRHLSPSPRRATGADQLPGILRRRTRSSSLDRRESGRSRQRPRVCFSPGTNLSPMQPRRGFLASIMRWVRSPFRTRMDEEIGRQAFCPQQTMERRWRPVVTPSNWTSSLAPSRRGVCLTGATGDAPPLPPRARAGAGVSQDDSRRTVNRDESTAAPARGRIWTNEGHGTCNPSPRRTRRGTAGCESATRHPARAPHGTTSGNAQVGHPSHFTITPGRTPNPRSPLTRTRPVGAPSGRSGAPLPAATHPTGRDEGVDSMDVDSPHNGAVAPRPRASPQGSAIRTLAPRTETARCARPMPHGQVSMTTRSRARNAAVFPAMAPPTIPRTVSTCPELGPRQTLGSSAATTFNDRLPGLLEGERSARIPSRVTDRTHTNVLTSQERQHADMDADLARPGAIIQSSEVASPGPGGESPPPTVAERTAPGAPLTLPRNQLDASAPSARQVGEDRDQAATDESGAGVTSPAAPRGEIDRPSAQGPGEAPTAFATSAAMILASPATTTRQTTLSPPPPEASLPPEPRPPMADSARNAREATARSNANTTPPLQQLVHALDSNGCTPGFRPATPPNVTAAQAGPLRGVHWDLRSTLPQGGQGTRTDTADSNPAMTSTTAMRDEPRTGSPTEADNNGETQEQGLSDEGRISTRTRSRTRVTSGSRPSATALNRPPVDARGNNETDSGFGHTPLYTTAAEPTSIPATDLEPVELLQDTDRPLGSPLLRIGSDTGTGTQEVGTTAAISLDQRDEVTPPQDPGTSVTPGEGEIPTGNCRSELSTLALSGNSTDPDSQSATASPQRSREAPHRGHEGDIETGPRSGPPEGGREPSRHHHAPSPTCPESTESSTEVPVCGSCLCEARETSVSLPDCGHAMCMGCYARACVREVGDVLRCPMCRVGSTSRQRILVYRDNMGMTPFRRQCA